MVTATSPAPQGSGKASRRALRRLLVASDLSARSDRALDRAIELACTHGVPLSLVHVVDQDLPPLVLDKMRQAADETLASSLARHAGRSCTIAPRVIEGKDADAILTCADAEQADLIILGIHRNDARSRPLSGTTMERVVRRGRQPALVVSKPVNGPYRRVMVAVDFSIHSRSALRAVMALTPQAEFHLVHAFHVPFGGFVTSDESREAVRQAHEVDLAQLIGEEMDALTAATGAMPEGRIQRVMRHGEVRQVLHEEATRLQPDLIVLGTHGRAGIARLALGSVAEDFLGLPPADVLAVKAW